MDSFALLQTAASGMEAQRRALEVAARNVAAAEAAGPKGSYPRMVPHFRLRDAGGIPVVAYTGESADGTSVDTIGEMIAVLNASRAYEANATVFDLGKQLAQRTIEMGRL